MAEDLRREVCSNFDRLSRGSFKKSLTNILTVPVTSTNSEVYVYIIHEKATNYSDLSDVLANLSDTIVRNSPKSEDDNIVNGTVSGNVQGPKRRSRHVDNNHKTWPGNKLW
jgi:hypothetical protein